MDLKFQVLLLSILLGIRVALGAVVIEDLDELSNRANDYDFVIIGGGTAGSVVATRLGENPKLQILVIEAGPSNEEVFDTRVPGLWTTLAQTRVDWNYTTTPQTGINGEVVEYPRAKMLGGCSSHNGMVYTRGSKDDWDRYASIIGNKELTWQNILPVMFKTERLTNPTPVGHLNPAIHGKNGKVSVSAPFTNIPFNDMLLQASAELKEEFPFLLDMNDGKVIGTGWIQSTINNGERSSAATAYLGGTGNNVHVLLNTQVTRVVPVNSKGLEFRGVEVAANAQAPRRTITAKKEVIVSGGVIGTPHVLLHSGIGDRKELEKVGIHTLVDNPSVGKNFSDHTSTPVAFAARTQSTDFDQVAALEQWNKTRSGPLAQLLPTNHITWIRLPADSPPFHAGLVDPTAGPNSPHIEVIYLALTSDSSSVAASASAQKGSSGSANVTIQTLVVNLHPISRGSVTLASSDPFHQPLIDFAIFTQPEDMAIAREGIRNIQKMFSAPGLRGSVFGTSSPAANVTSDEELDAFLKSASTPLGHALGSAAMSPHGASWGVVDPDFRVKGTSGLRVVDASLISRTPSGHTQAAVYAFAEMASAAIAADYK
ncbi:GMC oxidoreductase [Macrolepiota fuliginosa MF-IS2]|uniref:pyranose dehydrogenase (acceptor) n=1 Tax=Macrolepiota fuliginosa MF-IS2 TaxID=1400762 RepID=A0A9P5XE45_9AGAR|nr:GMC oxidoreductase [Macrolepiota fuliginosa MF-IS2]